MSKILGFLVLIGLLFALGGCSFLYEHSTFKQTSHVTLNGKPCVAVLTQGTDPVRLYSDGGHLLWKGLPHRSENPWKIQIGDVDGDGKDDIGIGVYKKAKFHPVMAKRPFIYNWDGKNLTPKWLGSRLSRPFTDFVLAEFGGSAAKLVAIEETSDGMNELAIYGWNGFGFTREWSGARAKKLSKLAVYGTPGKHRIKVTNGRSAETYIWNGKNLQSEEGQS